ncbi:hypothetical protein K402DRAFT_396603 [Aulographum hederae CBS 113979]|uniref:Uncharacterized protein n=1 Tax=Aulographum hederae CBS 113979 TaxID=1176131 RepID=A0A6G1GR01_9PEZI|nr:hypothetical protein K402DRAFT_396603 [Aulographum hederae CBS 113979]
MAPHPQPTIPSVYAGLTTLAVFSSPIPSPSPSPNTLSSPKPGPWSETATAIAFGFAALLLAAIALWQGKKGWAILRSYQAPGQNHERARIEDDETNGNAERVGQTGGESAEQIMTGDLESGVGDAPVEGQIDGGAVGLETRNGRDEAYELE